MLNLKRTWFAVAVGIAAVIAVVLVGYRGRAARSLEAAAGEVEATRSTAASAPARSDGVEGDAVSARLHALESEVSELRDEVARLRSDAHRERERNAPEPELTHAKEKAEWDEQMSLVDADFNEEPTDARWAGEASSAIQRALASQPLLHAATRSTECRSKTCRVELALDAQVDLTDTVDGLAQAIGPQLPTVRYDRVDEPGGRQTQVLYFSREGELAAAEDAPQRAR